MILPVRSLAISFSSFWRKGFRDFGEVLKRLRIKLMPGNKAWDTFLEVSFLN